MIGATVPLVVTAGEPAGIGPDLCVAIGAKPGLLANVPDFVVLGDEAVLRERAGLLGLEFNLQVIHLPFPEPVDCGKPSSANAATLLEGLSVAVDGCRDGRFSALVTAPLAKHVINDAGIAFTGHTEFIAERTATPLPVMMLVAGDMRVALASTHMPLRAVPDYLTAERLRQVLQVLHDDLRDRFSIESPRIVVCGLNPHAGEGGHLGTEDRDVIAPVIADCNAAGMDVRGPYPADTAFNDSAGPRDAVLAMYHDQGLPVIKYAAFGDTVNLTLGLPIVRTSVDHGTAFDIAGTGRASPDSLVAAMRLADSMRCP